MRQGRRHLTSPFLAPLFVLLSLGMPGRLVYCIGSDGHEGVELAGVPCASGATQLPETQDIGGDALILNALKSCVDIPVTTAVQCPVVQWPTNELVLPTEAFVSAGFAFADLSFAGGLMLATPARQLQPALPRAPLRTVVLLV